MMGPAGAAGADTRFAERLESVMGLSPASIGLAAVERAVAERMRATLMADADAYWDHLHMAPEEMQALIEAVVVPETWFFRDPAAFAAMVGPLRALAAAEPLRNLRLLSLPCSSGEEPYTIAMALLDAGLPASRFRIDAIDISQRALDLARRGLYGRNSFRSADLSFRDRHFDALGRDWRIRDGLRACVHFTRGNVIAPGFLAGAQPYDVIFCRNMLIYFDPATQQRVAGVLTRLLRPDGLLFAGHSEAGVMSAHGFASAQMPMAFAFRHRPAASARPGGAEMPARPRMPGPAFKPRLSPARAAPRPPARAATAHGVTPAYGVTPAHRPAAPTLEALWALVNAGRMDEAARGCEAFLHAHGGHAEAYLLLGLISDARGDGPGAAGFYRKALYLDPNHGEALDHLALLMRRQGDEAGARRLANRQRRQGEDAR
jgi:chemotaxis protein methyltransferase WspC